MIYDENRTVCVVIPNYSNEINKSHVIKTACVIRVQSYHVDSIIYLLVILIW